ncbi:uncharacterized protein LOC116301247 [Actinia tenebrosa]|uniref:Uncharacterized protein LOC116301247 n=1 Tax=Actinia tenebrosa TaxID=6105 RepID=A0A6P8IH90_ACTTE|nr:uncharacterized protein LOC116301247 [Actinia tenebrosa]
MMMFYERLLIYFSFLVLLTLIPSSRGCTCDVSGRKTPEFLCDFDYVLHGEVIKETIIGSNASVENHKRVYTVQVKEIFKGSERIKNISKDQNTSYVDLYTSYYGPACGITLILRKKYVIAGAISQNNLTAHSCGWNREWGSIESSFKEYFPKLKDCSDSNQIYAVRVIFLLPLLLTFLFIH